ncbi:hypothetical protein Tco_1238876 [Tanacetum coccineum]
MVDSQLMEEEIQGAETRDVGTETHRGPTEPVLQAQKTPSPSSAFIKENINVLRIMIKEHDQQAKIKATPRRLAYADSDKEAPVRSLARGFSDRFSLGSSGTSNTYRQTHPASKIQRTPSKNKEPAHLRRSRRLKDRSITKKKARRKKSKSETREKNSRYQRNKLDYNYRTVFKDTLKSEIHPTKGLSPLLLPKESLASNIIEGQSFLGTSGYIRNRYRAYQRQVFTRKRAFTFPNTAYPPSAIRRIHEDNYSEIQRKEIRHISAKSSQENAYSQFPIRHIHLLPYAVKMDDLSITMEEYTRLDEEKDHRRAIVFNDTLTSEVTLSCEPMVSPLNDNKIDFRISFDESDDEDYTPKVNCFDDLDFFKDFENEFPAIVYNDALTSKSDFSTEPAEQNVLYFNGLFPFNVMYPDDSKSDKDNDDYKIDIKHSSRGNVINTDDGAYGQSTVYRTYSLNEYSVFDTGPREGKSKNVGGEFTNLEILKCWSLETSRRLFNTNYCSINLHGESTEQYQGSFSF